MAESLSDDLIKLVRYSIVMIAPCRERLIHQGEHIVRDNLSADGFTAWMIASYLDRRPEPPIEPWEKRYLRVWYEVLCRWPRQEDDCEERLVDALHAIRDALRSGAREPGPATVRFDISSFDGAETLG